MPTLRGHRAVVVVAVLVVAVTGFALAAETVVDDSEERAEVTVVAENGTALGTVEARIADTWVERYVGLSATESLDPDEGMLFVHGDEGQRSYVMRDMAFPIDIVFIGSCERTASDADGPPSCEADGCITAIHHAEVEEPPLTSYRGSGQWVLEVPYQWTTDHDVETGHRVYIDIEPSAESTTTS